MKRDIITTVSEELIISGTIVYGDEFEPIEGYLCIKDNLIREVGTDARVDAQLTGLVAPCFVNAHTHIGDSVLKDPPVSDLDSIVKPPHGLKHRVLNNTPKNILKDAMSRTLEDMVLSGTCMFCDFREGGIKGASILSELLGTFKNITGMVMGRPGMPDELIIGELDKLLGTGSGLGFSGVNDVPYHILEEAVHTAHDAGKLFAIHAGEKDTSDIPGAIGLEPDFIVHMTYAGDAHIKDLSDAHIPAVVCPRSNFVTGVGSPRRPPIQKMLDMGITVGVGTDNVMLNSVNMFSEMEFLSKVYRLDDRQVFKLCTLNGAKILGTDKDIGSIVDGKHATIMVLDDESPNLSNSSDPVASLVRRGRPDNIKAIINGNGGIIHG
ncbi:MAG: 5'-deoxyadenosine deaminase [ANME-2 cluster archaeon]|nr:5'-deoxyadenosine deaminase [ANME-2 cluster archaeon]